MLSRITGSSFVLRFMAMPILDPERHLFYGFVAGGQNFSFMNYFKCVSSVCFKRKIFVLLTNFTAEKPRRRIGLIRLKAAGSVPMVEFYLPCRLHIYK